MTDLRMRREEIQAHWFLPYFMTAAFKIWSSVFFHTPPFIIILIFALLLRCFSYYCFSAFWVSNPQNPPPQINKGLFGFAVSITHNSKYVGPTKKSLFGFCFHHSILWFLSDELGVFSFQNSVFNDIFVIKHTCMDPLPVPCQVQLSLTSPPTAFSFTPKT